MILYGKLFRNKIIQCKWSIINLLTVVERTGSHMVEVAVDIEGGNQGRLCSSDSVPGDSGMCCARKQLLFKEWDPSSFN